tara:strand:+ start:2054 stop:2173 length:120 start_codon:yes stop_codon:yes gene_type:complete
LKKLAKEIALAGLAYGVGIAILASMPFWLVIFKPGDMAK